MEEKELVKIKDSQGNLYKVVKTNHPLFKTFEERIAEITQLIIDREINGLSMMSKEKQNDKLDNN